MQPNENAPPQQPTSDPLAPQPQPQPSPTPQPMPTPQPAPTPPAAVPTTGMPAGTASSMATPKSKSKMKTLMIAAAIVVVLVVAGLAGLYMLGVQADKEAGLKKAQDFVTLLENSDRDGAIKEIGTMMGVDPNSTPDQTDSTTVQQYLAAVTQASQISQLLQTTDAKLESSEIGTTSLSNGSAKVTAHFTITTDSGKTGYYTVETTKKDGAWQLYSVQWSTTK